MHRLDDTDTNLVRGVARSTRGGGAVSVRAGAAVPGRVRLGALGVLGATLTIAGLALVALHLATFAIRNVGLQWDFVSYLTAVRAALGGLDPYASENLSALAGRMVQPFVYPPVTLLVFMPFTLLAPGTAAAVWMAGKLVLLLGLVLAWRRRFAPEAGVLALALVAVFGWNAAALWDLGAGNVAIVEAALLWSAFWCHLAGRRIAFAALVTAAACFKVMPAVFLVLLLAPVGDKRESPKLFIAFVVAMMIAVFAPSFVGPAAGWQRFVTAIPVADTLGSSNPSALGFFTTLIQIAGVEGSRAHDAGWAAWFLYALALVSVSRPLLARAWKSGDARMQVMCGVMLYVLLSPRPMAYGFVLLGPAPLFFAPRPFDRPWGRLALAAVLSMQGWSRALHHDSNALVYVYAPFLLAASVWLLVVSSGRGSARGAASGASSRAEVPERLAA